MPTQTRDRGCDVYASSASEAILLTRDTLDLDPHANGVTAEPARTVVVQVVPGAGWNGTLVVEQKLRAEVAPWVRVPYGRASDGTTRPGTEAIPSTQPSDLYVFDVAGGCDLRITHTRTAGTVTLVVQAGAY